MRQKKIKPHKAKTRKLGGKVHSVDADDGALSLTPASSATKPRHRLAILSAYLLTSFSALPVFCACAFSS